MTFNETRKKYEFISYDSFDFENRDNTIQIKFYYSMGEYKFIHKIEIPEKHFFVMENFADKDIFLFNLGLIEIINYYKLACPPKILLKAGTLKPEQMSFWTKLFYNGLGEFRYLNNIEINEDDFVKFENATNKTYNKSKNKNFHGNLIPIGGGKDSIVTLELLSDRKEENNCLIVNPRGATVDTVTVAGYRIDDTVEVSRKLDAQLFELNNEGFLNGHVPFSAMLAFLGIFCAMITGKKYVVLSNESSADEKTSEEANVNHQYSKTLEFEKDFVDYTEKYINGEIKYFSLLRGMREIDIARLFASHKKYYGIFRSCNMGARNGKNEWCCKCSKCLFVYIILSPFLTEEELKKIFGSNLLDDLELEKYYRELTGLDKVKPFECVGTRDEVNEALRLTLDKYKGKKLPSLLEKYAENIN